MSPLCMCCVNAWLPAFWMTCYQTMFGTNSSSCAFLQPNPHRPQGPCAPRTPRESTHRPGSGAPMWVWTGVWGRGNGYWGLAYWLQNWGIDSRLIPLSTIATRCLQPCAVFGDALPGCQAMGHATTSSACPRGSCGSASGLKPLAPPRPVDLLAPSWLLAPLAAPETLVPLADALHPSTPSAAAGSVTPSSPGSPVPALSFCSLDPQSVPSNPTALSQRPATSWLLHPGLLTWESSGSVPSGSFHRFWGRVVLLSPALRHHLVLLQSPLRPSLCFSVTAWGHALAEGGVMSPLCIDVLC